tara:strand:- start:1211 stop:1423 length:213 start_codon:yes stop_codon:yes gene_type:complete
MTPAELSDLSLRISALERVVERLAGSATGPTLALLGKRRREIDAIYLNPDTMADIKHSVSFERVLLRGVV